MEAIRVQFFYLIRTSWMLAGILLAVSFGSIAESANGADRTESAACFWSRSQLGRVLKCSPHGILSSRTISDADYYEDLDAVEDNFEKTEPEKISPQVILASGAPSVVLDRLPGAAKHVLNLNDTSNKVESLFLVLALGSPLEIVPKLDLAGDKDYLVLQKQPLANRVSLGIFSNIENAQRRREALMVHAISVELIDLATDKVVSDMPDLSALLK